MSDSEIKYPSFEIAKEIHRRVMFYTGDNPEECSEARLKGALARPETLVNYIPSADIIDQAALLCVAISQAQAFFDGNKRTAVAVTDSFLKVNGYSLIPNMFDIIEKLERIAEILNPRERAEKEADFADWLRSIVIPLTEPI